MRYDWLFDVLGSRRLPTGVAKSWDAFERRDAPLAAHARLHLHRQGRAMPPEVPDPGPALLATPVSETSLMIPLIDRYIRHGLMRSKSSADHALADTAKKQLMLYGIQVTQTGTRPCAATALWSLTRAPATGRADPGQTGRSPCGRATAPATPHRRPPRR